MTLVVRASGKGGQVSLHKKSPLGVIRRAMIVAVFGGVSRRYK